MEGVPGPGQHSFGANAFWGTILPRLPTFWHCTQREFQMTSPNECTTLAEVRFEIDRLDRAVVEAIGQRREYVRAASRFKRSENEVQAPDRQRKMLAARRLWAEEEGADPDLGEALFREIVAHFIAVEMTEFSGPEAAPTMDPHQPPSDKAASGDSCGKAGA